MWGTKMQCVTPFQWHPRPPYFGKLCMPTPKGFTLYKNFTLSDDELRYLVADIGFETNTSILSWSSSRTRIIKWLELGNKEWVHLIWLDVLFVGHNLWVFFLSQMIHFLTGNWPTLMMDSWCIYSMKMTLALFDQVLINKIANWS